MKVRSSTLVTSVALGLLPSVIGLSQQQTVFSPTQPSKQQWNGLQLNGNFLHITDMHVNNRSNVKPALARTI